MNVSRTERKVAAALRVQIRDGLVLVVQEGEQDQHLWVELYGRYDDPRGGPATVKSFAFTLSREDLTAICTLLQEFAAEIVAETVPELIPA